MTTPFFPTTNEKGFPFPESHLSATAGQPLTQQAQPDSTEQEAFLLAAQAANRIACMFPYLDPAERLAINAIFSARFRRDLAAGRSLCVNCGSTHIHYAEKRADFDGEPRCGFECGHCHSFEEEFVYGATPEVMAS